MGDNTKSDGTRLDLSAIVGDTMDLNKILHLSNEADHTLAVLATITGMFKARRESAPPDVEQAISAIQCAAMRFYFEVIPAEGHANQAVFDAALKHFRKVGTDA